MLHWAKSVVSISNVSQQLFPHSLVSHGFPDILLPSLVRVRLEMLTQLVLAV